MSTGCFATGIARCVAIICLSHDTLLFLESPSSVHPAATAAPEAVVFAEKILVASVVPQGAINKLLLRETHGRGIVLLGDCTFKCRVGSKGPARATIALLLDGTHESIFDVIDGGSVGNEATATTLAHHIVATATPAMLRHVSNSQSRVLVLQTEMGSLELLRSHIREIVVTESGCVGLARGGRLRIESSDLVVVFAVDLSAESHFSNGSVVLVVL